MGPSARAAAFGSALTLAACAVIAGLDDPKDVGEQTSSSSGGASSGGSVQDTGNASSTSGGTSSSSGASGDSSTDGASSSSGSPADAQTDTTPPCPLLKNGDGCQANSQCCSGKCTEKRLCGDSCANGGMFNCDPTDDDSCCVGFWCNTGSCVGCVLSGQPPTTAGGFPITRSCCSRAINVVSGNCL